MTSTPSPRPRSGSSTPAARRRRRTWAGREELYADVVEPPVPGCEPPPHPAGTAGEHDACGRDDKGRGQRYEDDLPHVDHLPDAVQYPRPRYGRTRRHASIDRDRL